MGWKYVIIETDLFEFPIIFPNKMVHEDVYRAVRRFTPAARSSSILRPASAGMIDQLFVKGVGGKSETLHINSRDADERIINMYNYEHGIKGL